VVWSKGQKGLKKIDYLIRNKQFFIFCSKICWYQCTVKGGREGRDIDTLQLVQVCEELSAGEILPNCIDKDVTIAALTLKL
jgi:glutamine amidotransferase/cyclase